ncbi:MAG TPA: tetratricopeptide repeat protein [bacterium]|nr:tetratricopeptide repeat protein [bacterium]
MNRDELISHLEARLRDNPKSLIFAWLADLYLEENRIPEAIQSCTDGIRQHPYYVTGHFVLAKAYLANQEHENAEAALKNVLSHDREFLSAHLLLGDLMKTLGWENKAAVHYRDILSIDPAEDVARERLGALSEAQTWDFTAAEETAAARQSPEVPIEKQDEDAWVDDIREIFPDEIQASAPAVSPDDTGDVGEEPKRSLKETLQDLDNFLDEKFANPISETPEFFSITDNGDSPTDPESAVPGPDDGKITEEFLGNEIAIPPIREDADSPSSETEIRPPAPEPEEDSGEDLLADIGIPDPADGKDLITEQDFQDALDVLEQMGSDTGQDSTETRDQAITEEPPGSPPEQERTESDSFSEIRESPAPPEPPDTPDDAPPKNLVEPEFTEKPSENGLPSFDLGALDFGSDTIKPDAPAEDSGETEVLLPDTAPPEESEFKATPDADESIEISLPDESGSDHPVSASPPSAPPVSAEADIPEEPIPPASPEAEPPEAPPPVRSETKKAEPPPPPVPPGPAEPQEKQAASSEEKPVPAPAPEEPGEQGPAQPEPAAARRILTPTLGDIYAAQGKYDKAIEVYQELLGQNPGVTRYQEKIEELRQKMDEAGQ